MVPYRRKNRSARSPLIAQCETAFNDGLLDYGRHSKFIHADTYFLMGVATDQIKSKRYVYTHWNRDDNIIHIEDNIRLQTFSLLDCRHWLIIAKFYLDTIILTYVIVRFRLFETCKIIIINFIQL